MLGGGVDASTLVAALGAGPPPKATHTGKEKLHPSSARPLLDTDHKAAAHVRRDVTGVTAASSGTSDSRVSRVTPTHTLVQKTGVSPVRRHWRALQRDVSTPEGGPRRYRQGSP